MKSIHMTTEQTAAYDSDVHEAFDTLVRPVFAEAQVLANKTGDSVEVYSSDGIVVHMADCREHRTANVYEDDGYWFAALWVDGGWDSNYSLRADDEQSAVEEAEALLGAAVTVVRE